MFYSDYFEIVNKAAYDAEHGKSFNILTSRQVFQRLIITLAQAKADNTS